MFSKIFSSLVQKPLDRFFGRPGLGSQPLPTMRVQQTTFFAETRSLIKPA